MSEPPFVIGIDLGTTHTAVAYVDTARADTSTRVFPVPQLVAKNVVEARELLPSFVYLSHPSEQPEPLPWDAGRTFAVGHYARTRGAEAPGRLVSSAKSWLCHPTLDRRAPCLPVHAEDDVEKISPVEASFRYLEHVAEAWDREIAKGDPSRSFAAQSIVLTVPASFDAGARELTAEAAIAAGIEHLTLLEEPQAALYAWLDGKGDSWRNELRAGDLVLVVDVGGGTTDFSAIAVVDEDGTLGVRRVAVGDHILLGGDNMDLALAYVARKKLEADGKRLDAWQTNALAHAARSAKEQLFSSDVAEVSVTVPGRGAKLLGGALRTTIGRAEIARILEDGFFPKVDRAARPAVRTRGALTQLGLPYAQDAAITRHLAAFLGRQAAATDDLAGFARRDDMLVPTAVLLNGGVFRAGPVRDRLLDVLNGFVSEVGAPFPRVLQGSDLDLAVARGAAAYGVAKRRGGLRIRGGTARAYYVGIESAAPAVPGMEPETTAVCVAPFGMEEGTHADLANTELGLVVGEPVSFRFLASSVRRGDTVGTALERFSPDELEELRPIVVTLPPEGRRAGDVVPVHLRATVTEVGTLLLEAIPTRPKSDGERWKIELDVREKA